MSRYLQNKLQQIRQKGAKLAGYAFRDRKRYRPQTKTTLQGTDKTVS